MTKRIVTRFLTPSLALWLWRPNRQSLYYALARHTPCNVLHRLATEVVDWRNVIRVCALETGVSEGELTQRIAKTMKLPYLERVAPVNLPSWQGQRSIAEYRKSAVIPVTNGEAILGYACVDPGRLLKAFPDLVNTQLYIAKWETIEAALQKTEQKIAERHEDLLQRQATTSLLQILKEVLKHKADRAVIRIGSDSITYRFRTPEDRRAAGQVDPRLAEPLRKRLNAVSNRLATIEAPDGYRLYVEILSPHECFALTATPQHTQDDSIEEVDAITVSPIINRSPVFQSDCTILVIEDNESFRTVLKSFLSTLKCTLLFATNGKEALRILETGKRPDVIVCDVLMPEMDGFSFVQQLTLREFSYMNSLIMLTSDDDVETQLRFLALGVNVFLAKNSDPRLLLAHITRIIERREKSHVSGKCAA